MFITVQRPRTLRKRSVIVDRGSWPPLGCYNQEIIISGVVIRKSVYQPGRRNAERARERERGGQKGCRVAQSRFVRRKELKRGEKKGKGGRRNLARCNSAASATEGFSKGRPLTALVPWEGGARRVQAGKSGWPGTRFLSPSVECTSGRLAACKY